MCKVTSIHVPVLVADELHEIPTRNVENLEREGENSDRGSNIVIFLCATILTFYILLGMPCACLYPTKGGVTSSSLRGAAFMMTIAEAGVEDSDEHRQKFHRNHPVSSVQFLLDSDPWHQLSSSDTNESKGSYSSDSDSSDNEQVEWLEIQEDDEADISKEDDDVDISEEDPNLTETLSSRRSINFLSKSLQGKIKSSINNIGESLSANEVDSSPSDNLDEMSYD